MSSALTKKGKKKKKKQQQSKDGPNGGLEGRIGAALGIGLNQLKAIKSSSKNQLKGKKVKQKGKKGKATKTTKTKKSRSGVKEDAAGSSSSRRARRVKDLAAAKREAQKAEREFNVALTRIQRFSLREYDPVEEADAISAEPSSSSSSSPSSPPVSNPARNPFLKGLNSSLLYNFNVLAEPSDSFTAAGIAATNDFVLAPSRLTSISIVTDTSVKFGSGSSSSISNSLSMSSGVMSSQK